MGNEIDGMQLILSRRLLARGVDSVKLFVEIRFAFILIVIAVMM
jgi:hypothetical protein